MKPLIDCKNPTFGGQCLKCNKCGRFNVSKK